ncbi:hypothetical protein D9615_005991 [Tricholomella constricta]|uniref:Glycosyltransferase family 18 catalytic domain-containing protein n=1 Tax=Tricholomella constricta TaxID=117010 RepID=A0A8H5H8S2_9AGAR|nr:hypothetical protein D9615_005991 [Tricholomella constricta]
MPNNDYERLPTGSKDDADEWEGIVPGNRRSISYEGFRTWFRQSSTILLVAAAFALLASIIFTVDLVYARSHDSGRILTSYNFLPYLWPVGLPNRTDNWENENSKSMHALLSCMASQNCEQNRTSIVLLSTSRFSNGIAGDTSGENIWAMSVLTALREMGYTAIFAPDNYELARTYRQYPDLVKIVILEGFRSKECFNNGRCIKTTSHPLGVPAWKLLSFHFWRGAESPLGSNWTLSPEDYARIVPDHNGVENVYLGYSIERTCKRIPIMPSSERPQQAYILAKDLKYFKSDRGFAWNNVSFVPPYPLSVMSGIRYNADTTEPDTLPHGITDLGPLNQTQFYTQLGKSRVLIGIGHPRLSPSPYDALCMGVPFINPILGWDDNDPDNRFKWESQHDALKWEDPPYVYNVRKDDEKGLWAAIKEALDHPIERFRAFLSSLLEGLTVASRYILPSMTMDALKHRVAEIVERDWKGQAEELLAERKASGKGQLFEL